jgi:L-seryl-tRNA(Ser) seleniumtransferase
MAQSGAVLREVGTTNRTRAADYAAAVSDRTALILRVHPSNFRIEGFTERADPRELVALGRQFGVPVAEDLGSGNLLSRALAGGGSGRAASGHAAETVAPGSQGRAAEGRPVEEPTVRESVEAGHDVVCFSGDKLLGGPQAGVIVGRTDLVATIRRHPLMRAFRVDKMTYAALEATLVEYAAGRARETVPVLAMLAATPGEIAARAQRLADRLAGCPGVRVAVVPGFSTVGGGSAPGSAVPTALLALQVDGLGPDALDRQLRALPTPVVARIEADRLVLDLRTVQPVQDGRLADLLLHLLGRA